MGVQILPNGVINDKRLVDNLKLFCQMGSENQRNSECEYVMFTEHHRFVWYIFSTNSGLTN